MTQRDLKYCEAVGEAIEQCMTKDPRVFLMGLGVPDPKGFFGSTIGLQEKLGKDRIMDMPTSENGMTGVAIGAALAGQRPIIMHQRVEFSMLAMEQMVNQAAKIHYRWGEAVPIVIRCPSGGGVHGGPFHSQNPEAWFCHVPGLKVVSPSVPYDAKGLIKAAIRDDNPVLYFEHKYLYRRIKGEVPADDYIVELGKADIKRAGTDMTVIGYSSSVHWALEAAEEIAKEGVEVEVLDLRTLLPYDKESILESVKKTNKVIITHEATLTGGIGGEIAAFISQHAFEYLDGPITRLAAIDTPVPYSPPLEAYFLPNKDKMLAAMRELAAY